MSNLTLAVALKPTYAALPSCLARSAVAISPRFPRTGVNSAIPASGTNGAAGTITPERSAVEAAAWGATVALWSYTDQATTYGFASAAAFVAEMVAAGVPIGGTTNTSAVNESTGPFMQDAGGADWSAGSFPNRPALNAGQPSPLTSRVRSSISYMPAADPTGTQTPKLAAIATQTAAGVFGLHMDDPRGPSAFSGWLGATSNYDLTGQGCDFSATARAGFTTWLNTNTTSAERIAVGLPSSLAGFDILVWLKANKASIMFSPNQVDGAAVDNYLYRTSVSNDAALRTIILRWMGTFLRQDHAAYVQAVRAQLAGKPLSLNLFNASPMEYMSWIARQSSQLYDYAVAETQPPFWSDLSSYTTGSASWMAVRAVQQAQQKFNGRVCDMAGLRAFFEHKPTAPNTAPARVVTQMLRQSIMQSVMDGHTPIVPIDIFMTTGGTKSQGVDVDGYRFWGSRADYKTCFDFIKANADVIDGFEAMATVHIAVHNDTFPFYEGNQEPRFTVLMGRMAELWLADVDYHLLPVGTGAGLMPQQPDRTRETTAPLILRLQDDADYYAELGRLSGPRCRGWSSKAVAEAQGHSPVRSTNPNVRATCRYNSTTGRWAVHLENYAVNVDGTPAPQTTTLIFNWGSPGAADVRRLGESTTTVSFSRGAASVSLTEYAIVTFAAS